MARPYAGRSIGRLRPAAAAAPGGGGGGAPPDPNIDLDPARGGFNTGFAGNRVPQFVVDAQWRTDMQALDAANDPWFVKLKAIANGALGDGLHGQHGATLYQTTGDTSYVARAYAELDGGVSSGFSHNEAREWFVTHVIVFDWLYAALTGPQRTNIMTKLYNWADFIKAKGVIGANGGVRVGDSDADVSYYGGMAVMDCLNVTENTRRGEFLQGSSNQGGNGAGQPPMGGINATAADLSTLRNVIKFYITNYAVGGSWFESSEYNAGTMFLVMQWYAAVKSTTLTDHFPEITAWIPSAGRWFIREMTPAPAYLDKFQYGDDEQPHAWYNYLTFHTYCVMGAIAGLLRRAGHADAALIAKFVADIRALFPTVTSGHTYSGRPGFCYHYPLMTTAADYSAMAVDSYSNVGRRIMDLDATTKVVFMGPPSMFVDHELNQYASPQVFSGGEFSLYNPIGYGKGGETVAVNGVLLCGLRAMNTRGLIRNEGSVASGWTATTWGTQGSVYGSGFYQPPAVFVTKAENRLVAFKEGGHVIIVTRDDLDVKDPSTLGNYNRYVWFGDQSKVAAALARNERVARIWHTPVASTSITGGFEWATPGGQRCTVYHPVGFGTKVTYDETTDANLVFDGDPSTFQVAERKFQTRVIPPVQDVNVMINVFMVGASGATRPIVSNASAGAITVGTKVVTFGASTTTVA